MIRLLALAILGLIFSARAVPGYCVDFHSHHEHEQVHENIDDNSEDAHVHTHRHSPNEPEHTHEHSHQGAKFASVGDLHSLLSRCIDSIHPPDFKKVDSWYSYVPTFQDLSGGIFRPPIA